MSSAARATGGWFRALLLESRFLARYPQYAAVVAQMEPLATSEVPIIAIGRHPRDDPEVLRLFVNADYFARTPQQFAGTLLHEIHHVLCGHLDDATLHRVRNPRMMELAMEMAANENITEQLPAAIRWQEYREFGIAAGQDTMTRYRLLARASAEGRLMVLDECQMDRLDPGWRDRLTAGDAAHGGQRVVVMSRSPSRSDRLRGRTPPPHVKPGTMVDEHRPGTGAGHGDRGLGDALDRCSDKSRSGTWAPSAFGMGRPTDRHQLGEWQRRIRDHVHGERGGDHLGPRVAKELSREVAWDAVAAGLAWSAILRVLLRQRRVVQPTYLRPNRRFPERVGELPGRTRLPPRPQLLVGVDTSASMNAAQVGRALAEVQRLCRVARCRIAEVDAAVQRFYAPPVTDHVKGGGDTDFAPLFTVAAASPRNYDAAVYFTDGVGPWPDRAPALPVLWVLTGDRAFDCPWGLVVRLSAAAATPL